MQAPNEGVVSAAIASAGRVFCVLLERLYGWFGPTERREGDEVALRYQKWMKQKYQTTVQMLVGLLTRPSLQVIDRHVPVT